MTYNITVNVEKCEDKYDRSLILMNNNNNDFYDILTFKTDEERDRALELVRGLVRNDSWDICDIYEVFDYAKVDYVSVLGSYEQIYI